MVSSPWYHRIGPSHFSHHVSCMEMAVERAGGDSYGVHRSSLLLKCVRRSIEKQHQYICKKIQPWCCLSHLQLYLHSHPITGGDNYIMRGEKELKTVKIASPDQTKAMGMTIHCLYMGFCMHIKLGLLANFLCGV